MIHLCKNYGIRKPIKCIRYFQPKINELEHFVIYICNLGNLNSTLFSYREVNMFTGLSLHITLLGKEGTKLTDPLYVQVYNNSSNSWIEKYKCPLNLNQKSIQG